MKITIAKMLTNEDRHEIQIEDWQPTQAAYRGRYNAIREWTMHINKFLPRGYIYLTPVPALDMGS